MNKPMNCFICWAKKREIRAALTICDDDPMCLECARSEGYTEDEIAEGMLAKIAATPVEHEIAGAGGAAAIGAESTGLHTSPDAQREHTPAVTRSAGKPAPSVDVNTKAKEEKTMSESPRVCQHPQCSKPLNALNKSGYCTEHWYYGKRVRLGKEPAPPAKVHKAPTTTQKKAPNQRVTIATPAPAETSVNVAVLAPNGFRVNTIAPVILIDNWWARQPSEAKATIFSNWLQTAQ